MAKRAWEVIVCEEFRDALGLLRAVAGDVAIETMTLERRGECQLLAIRLLSVAPGSYTGEIVERLQAMDARRVPPDLRDDYQLARRIFLRDSRPDAPGDA